MKEKIRLLHQQLNENSMPCALFGTASLKMLLGQKVRINPDDIDFLLASDTEVNINSTLINDCLIRVDNSPHKIFYSDLVIGLESTEDKRHIGHIVRKFGIRVTDNAVVRYDYNKKNSQITVYLEIRGENLFVNKFIHQQKVMVKSMSFFGQRIKVVPPIITISKIILELKRGRPNLRKIDGIGECRNLANLLPQVYKTIINPIYDLVGPVF